MLSVLFQAVWVRTSTGERLGEGGVLQLREVTRQQAGEYSCSATNSLGTSQKTILMVDVQCEDHVLLCPSFDPFISNHRLKSSHILPDSLVPSCYRIKFPYKFLT